MNIRFATTDDAKNLAVLAIQVFLDTYATGGIRRTIADYVLTEFTPDNMVKAISKPQCFILLVEQDLHIIGFSQVTIGRNTEISDLPYQAELDKFYIQEPFCNKGIGTKLISHTENEAKRRKVKALWLTPWIYNHRALAFYMKMGYKDIGRTFFILGEEKHENRILIKSI